MTKSFYDNAYKVGHSSNYDGGESGMPERAKMLWRETETWLKSSDLFARDSVKILEIGCGMALLSTIHPGWHGVEYSHTAVSRVRQRESSHVNIYEQDAHELSFGDEVFEGVYSWAAIEHMRDPHKVFEEIHRVLKKGGWGLIAPAWNCRSWTVEKIQERPWGKLSIIEKFSRLTIPIRESIFYRAIMAAPRRLLDELGMALLPNKHMPLRFNSLSPRWDLIEEYGHVSDDDAVASIDPHSCITFFRSRGYKIFSHQTLRKRLLARYEPVIIFKSE